MMTTDKNAGSIPSDNGDNLEIISGIGPKTAEALAHIGVKRLADLAQATPDWLAKALLDQLGFRVSLKHIETQNWIGQAQALLQPERDQSVAQPQADTAAIPSGEHPDAGNLAAATHWQQHAGFSLFFDYVLDAEGKRNWQTRIWQTRVYHDETDARQLFPGVAPDQWANWILQHADLPEHVRADFAQTATTKIDILAVEIIPTAAADLPTQTLTTVIRFRVTGANAVPLAAANAPYQIILHTVAVESGATVLVAAEHSQFQPGQFEYTHQLEFPTPHVGRYALQCIFLGATPTELLASYRGPFIRVTP